MLRVVYSVVATLFCVVLPGSYCSADTVMIFYLDEGCESCEYAEEVLWEIHPRRKPRTGDSDLDFSVPRPEAFAHRYEIAGDRALFGTVGQKEWRLTEGEFRGSTSNPLTIADSLDNLALWVVEDETIELSNPAFAGSRKAERAFKKTLRR